MVEVAGAKLVWDVIAKLVDKGFDLFARGEAQRVRFLKEIIAPLHSTFEQLYGEHLATFKKVRAMLKSTDVPARDIADYLGERELFERGSVELFARINSEHPPIQKAGLREMYVSYVYTLTRCLASPVTNIGAPAIMYYAVLGGVLSRVRQSAMLDEGAALAQRADALRELDQIVTRFQQFYATVQAEYNELRARCTL